MGPGELLQEFEIDTTPIWPDEDGRLEPIFLAGPPGAEAEEFAQLDPERRAQPPDDPPPAPRRRGAAVSLFGSLGVHLLPLLVLIHWSSVPAEIADAMPVQLVLEEPPSGPALEEAAPPPSAPMPETATISEKSAASGAADAPVAPAASAPPKKPTAIAPPPAPSPSPEPPPRKPIVVTAAAAAPPSSAAPSLAVSHPPDAQAPGPDPLQSDYFSRLAALTRDHLDLLPLAFLGGRRGQTILSIYVHGDGTIGRIAVKRSSGYPDIDTRIEQIITAVGRFPPPPERFHKPNVELDFNLIFPDALQQ